MKRHAQMLALLLGVTFAVHAQIVENTHDAFYEGNPESESRMYGVGSLGFGQWGNSYNPKFIPGENRLTIRCGVLSSTAGSTREGGDRMIEHTSFNDNPKLLPALGFSLRSGAWMLQADYFSSRYSDETATDYTEDFIFPASNGIYWLHAKKATFVISNQRLQTAVVYKMFDRFSIGVGAIFNGTQQRVDFNSGDVGIEEFSISLFKYAQFLATLNFDFHPVNFYLLYRSKSVEHTATVEPLRINGTNVIPYQRPLVSHPEYAGGGVEIAVFDGLHVSAEAAYYHFITSELITFYPHGGSWYRHHTLENTGYTIGARYSFLHAFSVGAMYDTYPAYKGIYLDSGYLPHVEKLNSSVLSASYDGEWFSLLLQYQHTRLETVSKSDLTYAKRNCNFLRLMASVPVSFL